MLVDQKQRLERFLDRFAGELAVRGSIVASYRNYKNRRLGPYYRLTVRDGRGVQRSVFLGSAADARLAVARQRLAELQAPAKEQKSVWGARRVLGRAARQKLQAFDAELAKIGLRRQGNEIRGWRRLNVEALQAVVEGSSPAVSAVSQGAMHGRIRFETP